MERVQKEPRPIWRNMRNRQLWGRVNSGKDLATLGDEQARAGRKMQRAYLKRSLITPHGSDAHRHASTRVFTPVQIAGCVIHSM